MMSDIVKHPVIPAKGNQANRAVSTPKDEDDLSWIGATMSDETPMSQQESEPAAHVRSRFASKPIVSYVARHVSEPDPLQRALRAETRDRTGWAARMQIGDDQAVLMEVLARSIRARRAIEIGTFTGYSALAVARGMGPEGRLLCCDVNEEWTAIARDFWQRAGVVDRIELRIGPALDTLCSLPPDDRFDLAFVDADKAAYLDYYEALVPRLRPGGILLADNTLQGGRVADSSAADESVLAIRAFNDRVTADDRVQSVILHIGDGLTVIQKRDPVEPGP
jgi:caffeoyl-CoA O-methyltransferase